ncbi:hypothetical protein F4823DRAFT_439657 [Ustulina deusta]|nr:hypothetical protein F4823DRAFT_439657 [Ustulina deusta]
MGRRAASKRRASTAICVAAWPPRPGSMYRATLCRRWGVHANHDGHDHPSTHFSAQLATCGGAAPSCTIYLPALTIQLKLGSLDSLHEASEPCTCARHHREREGEGEEEKDAREARLLVPLPPIALSCVSYSDSQAVCTACYISTYISTTTLRPDTDTGIVRCSRQELDVETLITMYGDLDETIEHPMDQWQVCRWVPRMGQPSAHTPQVFDLV